MAEGPLMHSRAADRPALRTQNTPGCSWPILIILTAWGQDHVTDMHTKGQ